MNSPPPPPIRHDLPAPQPLPRTRISRNVQAIASTIIEDRIQTSEDTEPIYFNQLDAHSYASIDPDHSISSQSNENDQVSSPSFSFSPSSLYSF